MSTELLIKNGRVIDPANGIDKVCDVLIVDEKIAEVKEKIEDSGPRSQDHRTVIDASGKLVVPGLIDIHVHFRQPGEEYKEDIYTGSRAAVAGGFTTVIAEPNTQPPIDNPRRLKKVLKIADKHSIVHFFSKACVSKKMYGKRLVPVQKLKEAGARAISDDGHPVASKKLMQNALKEGRKCGVLVNPHCEESELYRQRMAMKGETELFTEEPYTSEDGFINRDMKLAEKTGADIHISHVSLASSVNIIARAKKKGVKVTAEATPHHFTLTKEMGKEIGTNAKVNPPLRSKDDVEAMKQGLADGTIDIIASDHAPHSPEEKSLPWEPEEKGFPGTGKSAPFGIIGLETTLGLVLTYLVEPGILTLKQAIEKMTILPAKIFGLAEAGMGSLTLGECADVTIIDPKKKWKVDANRFYSKGRNCPFNGWQLQGKAIMTIVGGRIIMENGQIK